LRDAAVDQSKIPPEERSISMEVRIGVEADRERILSIRPQAEPYFTKDYFVVAAEEDILGFATVFCRKIPAPVSAQEAFIYLIDILEEHRGRGIGSLLVQKIIELEREKGTYQVRAYCDIKNEASHGLWLKNGFGISPDKMPDGEIPGSFVTYVVAGSSL